MVTETELKPTRIEGNREIYGAVTEGNDRIYSIETRRHLTERDRHMPVTVRFWGNGHWVVCNGERNDVVDRDEAHRLGQRWLAEGKTR